MYLSSNYLWLLKEQQKINRYVNDYFVLYFELFALFPVNIWIKMIRFLSNLGVHKYVFNFFCARSLSSFFKYCVFTSHVSRLHTSIFIFMSFEVLSGNIYSIFVSKLDTILLTVSFVIFHFIMVYELISFFFKCWIEFLMLCFIMRFNSTTVE